MLSLCVFVHILSTKFQVKIIENQGGISNELNNIPIGKEIYYS